MNKEKERLGEIRKNIDCLGGYNMKIIEYNGRHDVWIEFQDEYKAKVHTGYGNFKKGKVKNPYHPNIYGVGYLGQGKYKATENNKNTKAYTYWHDMLKRCYDPWFLNKEPTYIECYVCDEWLCFQNFAEWFYKNYYEIEGQKMQLDKDILYKGNKIYSPNTCIIAPQRINQLIVNKQKHRGKYPIGVYDWLNRTNGDKLLLVRCSTLERLEILGYFPLNKPFQAFTCYKNFKENYIKQVADEYKDLIPKELYEALYKYEVEINN